MPARRSSLITIVGILTLMAGLPAAAAAAWSHVPSLNQTVFNYSGSQVSPVLVADGTGGTIVIWQDARTGSNDYYARHVTANGTVEWATSGLAVCTAAGSQSELAACTDGAGGAIVAWRDYRSGASYDIYAQRILSSGAVAWTVNGVAVCTATGAQGGPRLAADASGGAYVVWKDWRNDTNYNDLYAQRILGDGTTQWSTNGAAICTAAEGQELSEVIPDGTGGMIAVWADFRPVIDIDIYAQRVTASATIAWAANGMVICDADEQQWEPTVVLDGAGGAMFVWSDRRGGDYDLYAQRVTLGGAVDWTVNGRVVCDTAGEKRTPVIAADGAGGAIVAWKDAGSDGDWDVFAQRLLPAGSRAWAVAGVPVCALTYAQMDPKIVSDGQGGAVVVWPDSRSQETVDLYGQRIDSDGVAQWTANGIVVSSAAGGQSGEVLTADGNGGFVVAWYDDRDGDNDIYAQRVDQYGYLGSPAPVITGVGDVPDDQGGKVKLSWTASYLDQQSDPELDYYDVLRSVPPNAANAALARGVRLVTSPADLGADKAPCYLVTGTADKAYYWEYLAAVSAFHYLSGYSYIAATLGDSTAAGDPATAFMVVGRNSGRTMWWLSAPASGRSVDNLGPAAPVFLASRRVATGTLVRWQPNTEADLGLYRLYRGDGAGFTPGPASLVAAQADTGYVDPSAPPYAWYKLTAVDVHGNESPVATLGPSSVADVPAGGAPAVTQLARAVPNPFNPTTTLAFTLREAGPARLAVYDAAGRLVRTLVDGDLPAGRHEVRWDGRDARGGALPAGVFLCRLEAGAYRATQRVTLLK